MKLIESLGDRDRISMNEVSPPFSELRLDQLREGDVVVAFRSDRISLERFTAWNETVFVFMGCGMPRDFESGGGRNVSSGVFVVSLDVIVPARGERKIIELPEGTLFRVLT